MNDAEPIVAVALLTRSELTLLGAGFRNAFPIDDAHSFVDLLDAIDAAEPEGADRLRDNGAATSTV